MSTIEHKGTTVEYDPSVLTKWRWQRAVASGDMTRTFAAFDELLCGKSDEVAEQLGGEMEDMQDLILAIMAESKDQQAKN